MDPLEQPAVCPTCGSTPANPLPIIREQANRVCPDEYHGDAAGPTELE